MRVWHFLAFRCSAGSAPDFTAWQELKPFFQICIPAFHFGSGSDSNPGYIDFARISRERNQLKKHNQAIDGLKYRDENFLFGDFQASHYPAYNKIII